jgi:hypothetical protein
MALTQSDLPPELEMFSRIVDGQPPDVRELFLYAMTMLMVEDGKAEITEQRTVSMREQLTLRTASGDWFTIIQPFISEEMLAFIRLTAREVVDEDRRRAGGRGAAPIVFVWK